MILITHGLLLSVLCATYFAYIMVVKRLTHVMVVTDRLNRVVV
jgi:hypothetical protein